MKRFLPIITFIIAICSFSKLYAQVFIDVNGNDANSGSLLQPKATLNAAIREVRELRRRNAAVAQKPIHIILQRGTYYLSDPIFIRPEDAGTARSPTIIESAENAKVIISGGVEIKDWKKLNENLDGLANSAHGNIWSCDLPEVLIGRPPVRQLWVNNKKATRARWPNGSEMKRILNWNKIDETCQIPLPPAIANVSGTEMFIHQWWEIAILRIGKIKRSRDNAQLFFHQPESRIQSEHPWPAPWLSEETGNSAFYLSNAIEFLDEPGEWYADYLSKKIYYWPRKGENLNQAFVIVPLLENLIRIEGTPDNPVKFIGFKNISFQYATWNRPSLQGHVPHQVGMPMIDAYKLKPAGTKEKPSLENQAWVSRPVAAVSVSHAQHTFFENCAFEHLTSTALDYHCGVNNNLIEGNLFNDIGGTAILGGVFSDEAREIHLPYLPADERAVCDSLVITNNFITDATNEDWGTVGIGLGYTRNSIIQHNEIENVNYSGISMGWGWSAQPNVMRNNKVLANKIHHYGKENYDCAGIYTLSAQPGSLISGNYIDSIYEAPYAHLPSHWFYLYTDEGSSYITVKDNWTPSQKYLQNNNGPGNEWVNNGPQVSQNIKLKAGLQPQWIHLEKENTYKDVAQSVNTEHPELIELVTGKNKLDIKRLKHFLLVHNVNPDNIYEWKNHYLIFDKIPDLTSFQSQLKKEFPDADVHPFYDLYYRFDRSRCADTIAAKEWKHIILTCNLVADKSKQQAYLNYHATQFEKWPEVAQGFCNASFQQLLGFKRGRQIVIVISIPKEKTLDELNPRTIENNPRVVEWNKIMAQYQEGIEGAKNGEIWTFFDKVGIE